MNRTELFERYCYWTAHVNKARGHKTSNELYKALSALGYEERKSTGERLFLGIQITGELSAGERAWAAARAINATT